MEKEKNNLCPSCEQRQSQIYRISDNCGITGNSTLICENLNCPLKINFSKIQNWTKSKGQLKPELRKYNIKYEKK